MKSTYELDFDGFRQRYQKVPVEEHPNDVLDEVPEPMVSVHVSTYQHADFIRDCLDGVLMQETDFPVEIIIGEDESSDGTREICREYADRHPDKIRLFLHRRENNISIHGRPTGRFQFAYSHFIARGKYIAICEGDDYWTDPMKLQKQIDFLEENEEYVLSHHDSRAVNESGEKIKGSRLPDENKKDYTHEGLMSSPWLLTSSFCYRKIYETYPPSFFKVMNADLFIVSILGRHGRGKYQKSVKNNVCRRTKTSMWNPESDNFKKMSTKNTISKVYEYQLTEKNPIVRENLMKRYSVLALQVFTGKMKNGKHISAFSQAIASCSYLFKNGQIIKSVKLLFTSLLFSVGDIRNRLFHNE